jgi:hypothetical protein
MQSEINLLKPIFSENNDTLSPVMTEIRKYSILGLIGSVGIGIIVLAAYLVLMTMRQSLVDINTGLIKQLDLQKGKESQYVVVKSRIDVVSGALASSKPMSRIITYATDVAQPPKLTNISEDDTNRITINMNAGSIDESMNMAATLVNHLDQHQIRDPLINSYTMNSTGINIIFSFIPVWDNL